MADKEKIKAGGAPRQGVVAFLSTSWRRWALDHLFAPLITGITVALVLLMWGPIVVENLARQNPTCEDPDGAIPLPRERLVAVNDLGEVDEGKIKASKTHEPQPEKPEEFRVDWDLGNTVDGESQTFWVPQVPLDRKANPKADAPYIRLEFDQSIDLALVCVVNGYQLDAMAALTADRLRTIEVRTDASDSPEVTYLQVVGGPQLQNPQTLRIKKGQTRQITLSIIDVYPGQQVSDPTTGKVIHDTTGHTTIGEIYLFSKDPDVKPVWRAWWPVDWPFD